MCYDDSPQHLLLECFLLFIWCRFLFIFRSEYFSVFTRKQAFVNAAFIMWIYFRSKTGVWRYLTGEIVSFTLSVHSLPFSLFVVFLGSSFAFLS